MTVVVGLLDSGLEPALAGHVDKARRFTLDDRGLASEGGAGGDSFGHGSVLARIILARAPGVRFLNAQLFVERRLIPPAAAAAAVEWSVAEGARLVNMSFGLTDDRQVLRRACAAAVEAGVGLVAAAPARGRAVYPSTYPGVVRVSADARCRPGNVAVLEPGHFGACPYPPGAKLGESGGSSFAVAHVSGLLAALLADIPDADIAEATRRLAAAATHHGRERRAGKASGGR